MYIHEQQDWTAFTWDAVEVNNCMEKLCHDVGTLYGRLNNIGLDARLNATVETMASDVVASSEIEGVSLNTDEVRSSVARKLGVNIKNEKEPTHYVEGVVEMMLDAVVHFDAPMSEERLFGWHCALFPNGRSGYTPITVGAYRTGGMQVVSGMFGREHVHYCAPEAERVECEMHHFIKWLNDDKPFAPSYLKSAIAHLWFVCIHPFDDGNGRMARAISDYILSQADHSHLRFFSMSAQISKEKKDYYRVLESTQKGDKDITAWLTWYLSCMDRAVKESGNMLNDVLRKSIFWQTHKDKAVNERQQRILNVFLDGYEGKLSIKKWAKLAGVSHDTANRDIKDLADKGFIKPVKGRVRDIGYILVYTIDKNAIARFSDIELVTEGGVHYISCAIDGVRKDKERISDIDIVHFEQGGMTLEQMAEKYFSHEI